MPVPYPGLDSKEAARRLAADGPNVLPEAPRRGWVTLLAGIVCEPMFALLVCAALLYLAMGELHEGLLLAGMVALTVVFTIYQQDRTEHALRALHRLRPQYATVIRDGNRMTIPSAQLVQGDVIELAEGNLVPADALLLQAEGLMVDESLLTGESLPVAKSAADGQAEAVQPPSPAMVYCGSYQVQGHGLATVVATGARTEVGKLGNIARLVAPPPSPLRRESGRLARRLMVVGLAASVILPAIMLWRGSGWMEAVLAGLALSMSVIPEEFAVILTVYPAIGAWRLAQAQVLTRRLAAIETLGAMSVLCTDKTGTLTENRMAVRQVWLPGAAATPPDATHDTTHAHLLALAVLASREQSHDPLEQAFATAAAGSPASGLAPVHEYGMRPDRPVLVRLWRGAGTAGATVAAKGAPETIFALCRLEGAALSNAMAAVDAMAGQGLRVLAIAQAQWNGPEWPDQPSAFPFTLAGLAGLADPLRAGIPADIAACQAAGVRVIMITGDYPATARAICSQAGIADGAVLLGAEIAEMDDERLAVALQHASTCARVRPEQKLRIVQALQRAGHVVGMTGDGINDVPALKAADAGVAMGLRGTDAARDAAALTLLDDRFSSIVDAIRAGRTIYANMRKAMTFVLAMHVPIAGLALLPPLLGWPALLLPMHIAFLELIIDPACSLAFEREPAQRGAMRAPPRGRDARLFGHREIVIALLQGGAALALLAAGYAAAIHWLPELQARSAGFAALVVAALALLAANRQSAGPVTGPFAVADGPANPLFRIIAGVALAALVAMIYAPFAAGLFKLAPLPPTPLAAALATGLAAWPCARLALHHTRTVGVKA